MPVASLVGDRHHDHALVVGATAPSGETDALEALDRARGSGRVDAQRVGEVAHAPGILGDEQVEGVHLPGLEGVVALAEQVVHERAHRCATPQLAPGTTDAQRQLALCGINGVETIRPGGDHSDTVVGIAPSGHQP